MTVMAESKPKLAKVGKYEERTYEDAKADPKDIEKVEDRQPDQIADYHKKHPTLKQDQAVEKATSEPVT